MGITVFSRIEVQTEDSLHWEVYDPVGVDGPDRGELISFLFGVGGSNQKASPFEGRGLPADISDKVREIYMGDHIRTGQNGEFREMFGYSHAYASELPSMLLERIETLDVAAAEHDRARILVWFQN